MKKKDIELLAEAYIKEARPLPPGELGALAQTDIEDTEDPNPEYDNDKQLFMIDPATAFKIYDALLRDPKIGRQVRELFVTASNFHRIIDRNLKGNK